MDWQSVITALLVAACSGRAAWMVMPAAARQRLAGRAGQPVPEATACTACTGCASKGGCASATAAATPPVQPGAAVVHIVRRPSGR